MAGVSSADEAGEHPEGGNLGKGSRDGSLRQCDAVFESSGHDRRVQSAFDIISPTGRSWFFSIITEKMKEFDPSFSNLKEPIILRLQRARQGHFPKGGGGHPASGGEKLQILPMITHRFRRWKKQRPCSEKTLKAFRCFSSENDA